MNSSRAIAGPTIPSYKSNCPRIQTRLMRLMHDLHLQVHCTTDETS